MAITPDQLVFCLARGGKGSGSPSNAGRMLRPGSRASEDDDSRTSTMGERCSGHVERQRKARDQRRLQHSGNLPLVLERFRAKRISTGSTIARGRVSAGAGAGTAGDNTPLGPRGKTAPG